MHKGALSAVRAEESVVPFYLIEMEFRYNHRKS
jgi:hypothetical protein